MAELTGNTETNFLDDLRPVAQLLLAVLARYDDDLKERWTRGGVSALFANGTDTISNRTEDGMEVVTSAFVTQMMTMVEELDTYRNDAVLTAISPKQSEMLKGALEGFFSMTTAGDIR